MRNPELLGLLTLPAGAVAGVVRGRLDKPDGGGDLPIYRALRVGASPELVRAVLDAGGEAMLAAPGLWEHLPLHCAAFHSRSPAVVALLLARGPAGAARAVSVHGCA
jgi:hypothetical protein